MLVGSLVIKVTPLPALSVSANTSSIDNYGVSGTVYAGIELNTTGREYANAGPNSSVFSTNRGNWLGNGSSASVWVERTINSGSLGWLDPGAGRLQLNTTRQYGVKRSSDGRTSCDVTFDYYDASTGGNLLDSVTLSLTVERGAL